MGGCCSKDKDDKPLDFDVGIEVNTSQKIDTDNDVNFRNDIVPKTNGVHTQNELSLFQDLTTNNQDPELNTENEKEEHIEPNSDKNLNHESSVKMLPRDGIENVGSDIDKCENGVTVNFLTATKDTTVDDTTDTSRYLEKEDAAIRPSMEIENNLSTTNIDCEITAQQDQLKLSEDTKDTHVIKENGKRATPEVFAKENEIASTVSDTISPHIRYIKLKSSEDTPFGSNIIDSNNRNISDQTADCDLKISSVKQVAVEGQIEEQYGATHDKNSDHITVKGAEESCLTAEFHENQDSLVKNGSGEQRTVEQDMAMVSTSVNSQPLNDSSSACISSKHSEIEVLIRYKEAQIL